MNTRVAGLSLRYRWPGSAAPPTKVTVRVLSNVQLPETLPSNETAGAAANAVRDPSADAKARAITNVQKRRKTVRIGAPLERRKVRRYYSFRPELKEAPPPPPSLVLA